MAKRVLIEPFRVLATIMNRENGAELEDLEGATATKITQAFKTEYKNDDPICLNLENSNTTKSRQSVLKLMDRNIITSTHRFWDKSVKYNEAENLLSKRGKDKQPRKKRQPTKSQLLALEKGRAKSLEIRRNKKVQKTVMPPPEPAAKLDYSTFSNYMDMYEESRKKKHSTSKEPHPNKVIEEIHRPIPPKSKPNPVARMMNWTGGQSKFRETRWNYGF